MRRLMSRQEALARVTAAEILLARDPAPLLDGQETIPVTADETDDPNEEP